jgi:hypothetical protein
MQWQRRPGVCTFAPLLSSCLLLIVSCWFTRIQRLLLRVAHGTY